MHVTACLAGQKVEVEVGEDCRTLQALRECIVKELPQLCVEGFDVSVGGRALDDDEGVVSLQEGVGLDVVPNSRGLSVLALREAGREVSEAGLLEAAEEGDVSLCTLYLDAGVPVDCATGVTTSLHLACQNGHLEVARLLLDRGSTVIDEKDDEHDTPLHLACLDGHLEVARLLLDRGSTAIDEKNDFRDTPLHSACRNGYLEVATLLLDRGSTAINEKNCPYDTPLHLACSYGHLEVARLLLDRGSTAIDEKNCGYDTPLHVACWNGYLEVARLLLDRGSTAIDETNDDHSTPLYLACFFGYLEIARLLLDRGSTAIDKKSRLRPLARVGDGEWRVNTYTAPRLTRRIGVVTPLFMSPAGKGTWRSRVSSSTVELALLGSRSPYQALLVPAPTRKKPWARMSSPFCRSEATMQFPLRARNKAGMTNGSTALLFSRSSPPSRDTFGLETASAQDHVDSRSSASFVFLLAFALSCNKTNTPPRNVNTKLRTRTRCFFCLGGRKGASIFECGELLKRPKKEVTTTTNPNNHNYNLSLPFSATKQRYNAAPPSPLQALTGPSPADTVAVIDPGFLCSHVVGFPPCPT